MEREIVVSKRFLNRTLQVCEYLNKKFSSKTALLFLERVEERLELVSKYPTIGKKSLNKEGIRSILLNPHHLIFYRVSKNRVEIVDLFDMRQDPEKRPY